MSIPVGITTILISCYHLRAAACAEAGDATAALAEYEKMRAEDCRLDRHVFSALISALGGAIAAGGPSCDRRTQLVLLERAFHLLDDMKVGLIAGSVPPQDDRINPAPGRSCCC